MNTGDKSHQWASQYICNYCSKTFSKQIHILRHNLTHTGVLRLFHRNVLLEDICWYTLGRNHINAASVKRLLCRKVYLTIHMKAHTDKKPYKCSQCDNLLHRKVILHYIWGHTLERNHIHAVNAITLMCGKVIL